jgi:hypothetical protein
MGMAHNSYGVAMGWVLMLVWMCKWKNYDAPLGIITIYSLVEMLSK